MPLLFPLLNGDDVINVADIDIATIIDILAANARLAGDMDAAE